MRIRKLVTVDGDRVYLDDAIAVHAVPTGYLLLGEREHAVEADASGAISVEVADALCRAGIAHRSRNPVLGNADLVARIFGPRMEAEWGAIIGLIRNGRPERLLLLGVRGGRFLQRASDAGLAFDAVVGELADLDGAWPTAPDESYLFAAPPHDVAVLRRYDMVIADLSCTVELRDLAAMEAHLACVGASLRGNGMYLMELRLGDAGAEAFEEWQGEGVVASFVRADIDHWGGRQLEVLQVRDSRGDLVARESHWRGSFSLDQLEVAARRQSLRLTRAFDEAFTQRADLSSTRTSWVLLETVS